MKTIGVPQEEVNDIFRGLAAVLNLGELTACEVECVGTVNLVEPPRAVAEEGIAAIARYFDGRRV